MKRQEKPYDIFICYKDSDLANGIDRTQDSIAAQELYIHLAEQGYRVFFSRESLRGKVGEKYEPYIFNALSTAKVMLVYGSKSEYITSTCLKNEWHRFYKRITLGEKHQDALLVACDGFSPNELPSILSSRQCLDASKSNRNFYLDLDAAVDKIMLHHNESSTGDIRREKKVQVAGLHQHKYASRIVQASCISKGYTLHRCACGEEYKDNFTMLKNHKFSSQKKLILLVKKKDTKNIFVRFVAIKNVIPSK